MYAFQAGSTAKSILLAIDGTDGQPLPTLTHATAGLVVAWGRLRVTADTALPLVTLASATAAHAAGGFLNLGGGMYRLDLPDALLAAGAEEGYVRLSGAGTRPVRVKVSLLAYDPYAAGPDAAAIATQVRTTMEATGTELDNLHSRLTATRAGHLDSLPTIVGHVDTVETSLATIATATAAVQADVANGVTLDAGAQTSLVAALTTALRTNGAWRRVGATVASSATVTETVGGTAVGTRVFEYDAAGALVGIGAFTATP